MTINRLMNLPFQRLTENELNWLKNRTKDSREEVRALAKEIYSQRFPHAEHNQIKKQLYIKEITFIVNACVWDEYGDEVPVSCQFYLEKTEPVISIKTLDGSSESVTIRLEQGKYAKLLKSMIHYYEIFCWDQDYCTDASFKDGDPDFDFDNASEPAGMLEEETNDEEIDPTWSVSIKYTNGTEQNIHGTDDYLPDKVEELYWDLADFFAPQEEPDWELADFEENF